MPPPLPLPDPAPPLPQQPTKLMGPEEHGIGRSVCSTQRPEATKSNAQGCPGGSHDGREDHVTAHWGPWPPRGHHFSKQAENLNVYMYLDLYGNLLI